MHPGRFLNRWHAWCWLFVEKVCRLFCAQQMSIAPPAQFLHMGKACFLQGFHLVCHCQRGVIMIKFLIPDALFRFQTEQFAAEKRLLLVGLGKVVGQDQSPARHQCPEYFLIQRKLFRLGEMMQRFHRNHRVIALFPKGDVKVGALYKG